MCRIILKKSDLIFGETEIESAFTFAEENANDLANLISVYDYHALADLHVPNIIRKAHAQFQYEIHRSLAIAVTLLLASGLSMDKRAKDAWTPFHCMILAQQKMVEAILNLSEHDLKCFLRVFPKSDLTKTAWKKLIGGCITVTKIVHALIEKHEMQVEFPTPQEDGKYQIDLFVRLDKKRLIAMQIKSTSQNYIDVLRYGDRYSDSALREFLKRAEIFQEVNRHVVIYPVFFTAARNNRQWELHDPVIVNMLGRMFGQIKN